MIKLSKEFTSILDDTPSWHRWRVTQEKDVCKWSSFLSNFKALELSRTEMPLCERISISFLRKSTTRRNF
jgi:hypothetical protein